MVGKLKNKYFEWLKTMIRGSKNHQYDLLFKDLYGTKFRWLIANDINRSFEAKNLRTRFCDEMHIEMKDSVLLEDANLLEVMVALASRCEWIVMDDVNNLDISYWFMEFLKNLELNVFTDNGYYDYGGREKIILILDKFMNRTYSKNGKGGLFPLKFCDKNQRKVEIWYQMNLYLVENYYVDGI
jgi:hypothetical protein